MSIQIRHDWTREEISDLFNQPLTELLFQAHSIHRQYFHPTRVQAASLLNIKTGTCPENCGYCSQSGHHSTDIEKEKLYSVEQVREKAEAVKAQGASRLCLGAAWRGPNKKNIEVVIEMIKEVKSHGLEACVTLGMLTEEQAQKLKDAGLDYYNHNLDTSPEYYPKVVTTRTFQDRLDTLEHVRNAGINTCCGGIIGMGEEQSDRIGLLHSLATLEEHPLSVPINLLIPVAGTPLGDSKPITTFEFIRTIAVARILMPKSFVRMSAGRTKLSEEAQAMAFFAGANSIFLGDKLLTQANPEKDTDMQLMNNIGMEFHAECRLEHVS